MMYNRINRKQFEYFQAMTQLLQEGMLGSCNGLVKNQVDLIEEYSKNGVLTKEQMIPIIETINRFIEGYLNCLSLEYDLVLSRMWLYSNIKKKNKGRRKWYDELRKQRTRDTKTEMLE